MPIPFPLDLEAKFEIYAPGLDAHDDKLQQSDASAEEMVIDTEQKNWTTLSSTSMTMLEKPAQCEQRNVSRRIDHSATLTGSQQRKSMAKTPPNSPLKQWGKQRYNSQRSRRDAWAVQAASALLCV